MLCPRCKTEVSRLTRDHKIPQLLFKMADFYKIPLPFGVDDPQNIELVCATCNNKKNCKLEGPLAFQFLKIVRDGMDEHEEKGGYVIAKHKAAWRRSFPSRSEWESELSPV